MKRYVARHYHGPETGLDYGVDESDDESNEEHEIASYLTAAQANIMAFALNAVADGHGIAKIPGTSPKAITMYGEVYDGPTEGVAP